MRSNNEVYIPFTLLDNRLNLTYESVIKRLKAYVPKSKVGVYKPIFEPGNKIYDLEICDDQSVPMNECINDSIVLVKMRLKSKIVYEDGTAFTICKLKEFPKDITIINEDTETQDNNELLLKIYCKRELNLKVIIKHLRAIKSRDGKTCSPDRDTDSSSTAAPQQLTETSSSFKTNKMNMKRNQFGDDKSDDWPAKCSKLDCENSDVFPGCSANLEIKTEVDSPREYDSSDDDSDVIEIEPPDPKALNIEKLLEIRHKIRYVLHRSKKYETFLSLLVKVNDNEDFETLTLEKIKENQVELTTLETKVQKLLDICEEQTWMPYMQIEVENHFDKLSELFKTYQALKPIARFGSYDLEIAEEDRNFNTFEVNDKILIRIRISEKHLLKDLPKMAISKKRTFPNELIFKGETVYNLLANNETFIEVSLKENIDLHYSQLVHHLIAKLPRSKVKKERDHPHHVDIALLVRMGPSQSKAIQCTI